MPPRTGEKDQHDGHCETAILHPLTAANSLISNRHMRRVEIALTHSKQTSGAHATRHIRRDPPVALPPTQTLAFDRPPRVP